MLPPGYLLKDTYVVDRLHAKGGMALVYRVHHRELGVTRALKVLQPQFAQDENFVRRFRREAQIMAQLRHPNIAEVIDFGVTREGWLFLVMEWIQGDDLRQLLSKSPVLPVDKVLAFSRQISAALMVAHSAGIVHRDLKPANILICVEAGSEQLKVVDFGVARQRLEGGAQTLPGTVMGTPGYMAPEQLLGRTDEIDGRSDQFALGVMLYEMLLGQRLFKFSGGEGAALCALAYRISQLELPELPLESSRVRSQVSLVLQRAMASAPADRFVSIADFDRALNDAFLDHTQTVSVSVELITTQRAGATGPFLRQLLVRAAIGLLAIALGVTGTYLLKRYRHPASDLVATVLPSTAEPWPTRPGRAGPVLVIPAVKTGKPLDCRRSYITSILVTDDELLSAQQAQRAQQLVKECLQKSQINLTTKQDIVLQRTRYLYVMSGLNLEDRELLEHCLQKQFPHRPPRQVLIKRKPMEKDPCNAP